MLEDFLFPQEMIQYQSDRLLQYADTEYVIFITNRRVLGHVRHGLIRRKDRVLSVALEEITNLQYDEKGLVSKKGQLLIVTRTQNHLFTGRPEDVKIIWKEMQKHLGYYEPMGPPTAYSKPKEHESTVSEEQRDLPSPTAEALKVLKMRLATGEITKKEYEETKKTLEEN
jgi:hypothetical protein